MPRRATRWNLRPVLWVALSAIGFAAAVALQSAAFALLASLAIFAALLSVGRYPRLRD